MPDARSDRELLAAHASGEPHAFDELVRRHADKLWLTALRTLGHREDAADAVQDALISAFRSAGGYRGESEVATWMHRIVVNACLDRIRRRRLRAAEPLADHDVPSPRDPIGEHLLRMTVQDALREIPVGQRLAVVLVDMQGFGIAEAAEVLGVREGTVKSRCARGRLRLARLLGHLRPAEIAPRAPGGDPPADGGNAEGPADVEEETGEHADGTEGRR